MNCYQCKKPVTDPHQQFCTDCGANLQPLELEVRAPHRVRLGDRVVVDWRLTSLESPSTSPEVHFRKLEVDLTSTDGPINGQEQIDSSIRPGGRTATYHCSLSPTITGRLRVDLHLILDQCWVAHGAFAIDVESSSSNLSQNFHFSGHHATQEAVNAGSQTIHVNVSGKAEMEPSAWEFFKVPLELVTCRTPQGAPQRGLRLIVSGPVGEEDWWLMACPQNCRDTEGAAVFHIGRGRDQHWKLSGSDTAATQAISRQQGKLCIAEQDVFWHQLSANSITRVGDHTVSTAQPWPLRDGQRLEIADALRFKTTVLKEWPDQSRRSRYRRWCAREGLSYTPPAGNITAVRLLEEPPHSQPHRCVFFQESVRIGSAQDAVIRLPGNTARPTQARIVYLDDRFWLEATPQSTSVTLNGLTLRAEELKRLEPMSLFTIDDQTLRVLEIVAEPLG